MHAQFCHRPSHPMNIQNSSMRIFFYSVDLEISHVILIYSIIESSSQARVCVDVNSFALVSLSFKAYRVINVD